MPTFIIIWIVTSVLSYGFAFGYFQKEYPLSAQQYQKRNRLFALKLSVFPFAGMIIVIIEGLYKHGLKF
jgi:hypothetical protein